MKQLTIRGVDDELHHALRSRAAQHGMSINRYVISVIKESVGLANGGVLRDAEFDDLDDVHYALGNLQKHDPAMVVEIPRQPGQKEDRYAHLLCGAPLCSL